MITVNLLGSLLINCIDPNVPESNSNQSDEITCKLQIFLHSPGHPQLLFDEEQTQSAEKILKRPHRTYPATEEISGNQSGRQQQFEKKGYIAVQTEKEDTQK